MFSSSTIIKCKSRQDSLIVVVVHTVLELQSLLAPIAPQRLYFVSNCPILFPNGAISFSYSRDTIGPKPYNHRDE